MTALSWIWVELITPVVGFGLVVVLCTVVSMLMHSTFSGESFPTGRKFWMDFGERSTIWVALLFVSWLLK